MAHHPEDHHSQNTTLQSFILYVQAQAIQLHPSIEPYHFLRHGSGIRALSVLEVRKNLPPVSFWPALGLPDANHSF